MNTEHNKVIPKRSYTTKEAAIYIGMGCDFLRRSRVEGNREGRTPGPRFLKVGRRSVRYLIEDLDAWLGQFNKYDHLAQYEVSREVKNG